MAKKHQDDKKQHEEFISLQRKAQIEEDIEEEKVYLDKIQSGEEKNKGFGVVAGVRTDVNKLKKRIKAKEEYINRMEEKSRISDAQRDKLIKEYEDLKKFIHENFMSYSEIRMTRSNYKFHSDWIETQRKANLEVNDPKFTWVHNRYVHLGSILFPDDPSKSSVSNIRKN
jgi:hypothetical protein